MYSVAVIRCLQADTYRERWQEARGAAWVRLQMSSGRRAAFASGLVAVLHHPRACHCQLTEWTRERQEDLGPGLSSDAIGDKPREHAAGDGKVRIADHVGPMPRQTSRALRGADDAPENFATTPTLALGALKQLCVTLRRHSSNHYPHFSFHSQR